MLVGRLLFSTIRFVLLLINRKFYAKYKTNEPLPFAIFEHQTPLLRSLNNVDMRLQHNKVTNLRLATQRMNGIVIKPGEIFSFWCLVGKPSKRKGYQEGMVLYNGSFRAETGGGLCQLSNLIYWMTLHTPLTVIERWRHNYDVFPDASRTQPFGSGATVAYNYIDLQIRNDTNSTYQLSVWLGDTHLHGAWRSDEIENKKYQVYESSHWITHEWWGGYVRHNIIKRRAFDQAGQEISDEFITENHAVMMYEPLLPSSKI